MQAAQIPTAPNGINNIQQESLPMAPIITNQPPPPPAQTPTQQQLPVAGVPVQTTPSVTTVPPAAPLAAPREKKIIKIINPDTNENVLDNLEKTKKPEKSTESQIATISAPAPEYLLSHAPGGQIGLRKFITFLRRFVLSVTSFLSSTIASIAV